MVATALIEHFIEHGWVRLEAAFTAAAAEPYARRALERWKTAPRAAHSGRSPLGDTLPPQTSLLLRDFAPAAQELVTALAGGEGNLQDLPSWTDGFVVMPPSSVPWREPALDGFGWHIDGGFDAPRRLDSAEVGLGVYAVWNEVRPRGGGTFFAPGALPALARFLAEKPDGVPKADIPMARLMRESDPAYFEYSGPAGTVLVAHSLIPHAASWNASKTHRLLSVRAVPFARPLDIFGAGPKTPVEAATLRALEKSGLRRAN